MPRRDEPPAPRMARTILHVALLCYFGITAMNIGDAGLSPLGSAAAFAAMAAVYALQLVHSAPGARRAPLRRTGWTLGLQAALTYLPLVVFDSAWGSMAGFLAGSILLLLPPPWAWPLYGLVGISLLVPGIQWGDPPRTIVYYVQATLLTGLVTYGLTRLTEVVRALHDTREELSRAAVSRERLRFARDLHDLLGYSLSAVALKGELIRRLIPDQPGRAVTEVEDVLVITRQALADVRAVASGYRDLSLEEEVRSARTTLDAAGITVHADVRLGTVSGTVDTALATVLREGVTNVLRHSRATRCGIDAAAVDGVVRLSLTNDGAHGEPSGPSEPDGGSGLGNLTARLRAVGGTLTWRRAPDGTFLLVAEAPVGRAAQRTPGAPGVHTGPAS
ncbi:histidine kinase [Streptomyces sp. RFCAC02]|uniref:sensor histidine kinase n=1 Tax=Streptomyces sp. RFCAC02 TaxID=2499143 RepID=UPI001F0D6CFB|nr:histidine kinase [Streptomyces sp. RFCAC02]